MSEDTQWRPEGETIQDRAIATSRKLLEIGSNNANMVERVVFQEIGRVLSPRLEQRIRNVSEDEVRGQLVKLRTWIDDILGDQPEKKVAKRTHSRTGKVKNGKGRSVKGGGIRAAQSSKTPQAKGAKKASNAASNTAPVLATRTGTKPAKSGIALTTWSKDLPSDNVNSDFPTREDE